MLKTPQPNPCIQPSGKSVNAFNPKSFWLPKSPIASKARVYYLLQCRFQYRLHTVVMVTYPKLLSLCKLKKNSCTLQGIEGVIKLGFTSHRSNGLQSSHPKFPHLPLSEGGIFLSSWSWDSSPPTTRTVVLEVSNVHPR